MRELCMLVVSILVPALALAQPAPARDGTTASASPRLIAGIPLRSVRQVVDSLAPQIPAEFIGAGESNWEDAWTQWRRGHDMRARERLDRGDEDSLANWWMYGTSFTRLPPARARDLAQDDRYTLDQVLAGRLDDLLHALASARHDERLVFAREALQRRGIDPATRDGREAARRLLLAARARVREEFAYTDATLASAKASGDPTTQLDAISTIFKERGLSSDTSFLVDAAIDAALEVVRAANLAGVAGIHRVAIIGPGLDFINKADGHDFYPQQTIQPFAVSDSLLRHGLSSARTLEVTTIDISPRVNQHLRSARARASNSEPYILHLPLPRTEPWTPLVRTFWQRLGDQIATSTKAVRVPDTDNAAVRAIRIRPDIVRRVDAVQADIVTSRLVVSNDDSLDLIVATNVLVYYTPFEQALAAANIAAMLRPDGIFLTNNDVPLIAAMKPSVGRFRVKYSERQNDEVFVYQRR
jgi:SAM-dependent methyltransferase